MICRTIDQMQRVANAGAIKMHRQGYTYSQNDAMSNDLQTAFDVILPEAFQHEGIPASHLVSISPDENPVCFCSCEFYKKQPFGLDSTCKHIEYILAELAESARADAEELAEDIRNAERAEALNMIEDNDRAHGSQWHTPCHVTNCDSLPDHSIYQHYINA